MKLLSVILIITLLHFSCKQERQTLFKEVSSNRSNIHFNNEIKETESLNIVNYEYLYNGGGVGVGDFNNDSLPDIYFTGNLVSNKLYINRGNMQFEDVTEIAGVTGNGKWCKGVSVIDINNDGMLDIYVSVSVTNPASTRTNMLFVCERIDPVLKIPQYREMAKEYGLADTSHTQMASFFDYDNDGDLDVYLLVNELNETYPNDFRPIRSDGTAPNNDRLLRNDWNTELGHAVYTDVTKQAGITWEGYGLGVSTCDINGDGWVDIYVSNDYLSNNEVYINNQDGTFTNRATSYFKHTSRNAMGNDIADINNDGLPDVVELDMAPSDNRRLKLMNNPIKYSTFQNSAKFGYMHQYVRNVLQVNQGPALLENDSISHPVFSETGYLSGIAHTDWSWAPLLVDVDNDGWRDLIVTNGLPKDMTDMDFMAYRQEAKNKTPLQEVLKQLPSVKIPNYIFRNNRDYTFTDESENWGWTTPGFSAGMAYADFDRDGDLDFVINNTNMEASLIENKSTREDNSHNNYLQVQFKGDSVNINGIGARTQLFYNGQQQVYENNPYRGYLSSVQNVAHFGLGETGTIDSVVVYWPGNRMQVIEKVASNQQVVLDIKNATGAATPQRAMQVSSSLFADITSSTGIDFTASESDFIDFSIQRLIPHKLSQYGPALATGDINGDGLDDLIIGGTSPNPVTVYVQQPSGKFVQRSFTRQVPTKATDDTGLCLFDADGDGDVDLYITSGGFEIAPGSTGYGDQFYRNDGKGNFTSDSAAIPKNLTSKSCVKAADFDNDGDVDLFVGGRVLPGSYPLPVSSYIYRNDGKGHFTDVTSTVAPGLTNIGLVADAVWTDINNDGSIDLVIAGEWMAPTIFRNQQGQLSPLTNELSGLRGWFNSITAADLDNDGDMDYVMGNCGTNGFLQPSAAFPVKVYGKDFDKNGSFDAVLSTWLPETMHGAKKEYPAGSRDELIREMAFMKGKFVNYTNYSKAEMKDVFSKEELEGSYQQTATIGKSGWIENKGNFNFIWHDLPMEAQFSAVFGISINDFNSDGNPDILVSGNDYGMAPTLGRSDALNGLVLLGNGKGGFKPLSILAAGVYIPGDGKALVQLAVDNKVLVAASQNQAQLKLFRNRNTTNSTIPILPDDISAIITFKNGQKRKEEFHSARFLLINNMVVRVEIKSNKKESRTITF